MTDSSAVMDAMLHVRKTKGANAAKVRRAAETQARELLDAKAGSFDADDLKTLFEFFCTDATAGTQHLGLFEGSFAGFHAAALADDMPEVNDRLRRLWGDETESRHAADSMLRRGRLDLPMGGQSFPTMVLYVKDPTRFAVAQSVLTRGCRALGVDTTYNRSKGYLSYLDYCRHVHAFAVEFGLEIQEVDAVFAYADPGPPAPANPGCSKQSPNPAVAERMCGACFQVRRVSQFVGDVCTDCV